MCGIRDISLLFRAYLSMSNSSRSPESLPEHMAVLGHPCTLLEDDCPLVQEVVACVGQEAIKEALLDDLGQQQPATVEVCLRCEWGHIPM